MAHGGRARGEMGGGGHQIKKKVMWGNGEGVKGTCWAPAPGVGG